MEEDLRNMTFGFYKVIAPFGTDEKSGKKYGCASVKDAKRILRYLVAT